MSTFKRIRALIPPHIQPDPEIQSYDDLLKLRHADESNQPAYFAQQRIEWIARNSNMSERFRRCNFANYEVTNQGQEKALRYAQRYAQTFSEQLQQGKGFIFAGKPGTGKNHLASAIVNHLCESLQTALVITVSDLIGLIRASWQKDSKFSESQVISRLISVDLLIIDEVGLQRGSEDEQLQLTKIIDKRLYSFKPTSILSNCESAEEIKQYIGFRAYDRLREGALFVMRFDWESYRGSVQ